MKMFELSMEKGDQLNKRLKKAIGNLFFMSNNVKEDNKYKTNSIEYLRLAQI